jgi:hypothetical protein
LRTRTSLTAIAAAAVAILLVMPALLFGWGGVVSYVRMQSGVYSNLEIGSFWSQAVFRAEWDQPLASPELGAPFLVLSAAGVLIGSIRRETRKFFAVAIAFALVLGALLVSFPFRPFRNVLPLVPLGCVSLGLFYDAIRRRLRRRGLADAAAALALACSFAPALVSYGYGRVRCVDSRVEAVDWMLANAPAGRTVALDPQLALLPREVTRLGQSLTVVGWGAAGADFLFLPGDTEVPAHVQRAAFGDASTPQDPGFWRGNRQRVRIVERSRSVTGQP